MISFAPVEALTIVSWWTNPSPSWADWADSGLDEDALGKAGINM